MCIFHGVKDECEAHQNVVILTLQPNEGFETPVRCQGSRQPASLWCRRRLHFDYDEAFQSLPDAYQTLILDVMEGDQTLFVRSDEVETSWALYTPLFDADIEVLPYAAGTWGPEGVAEKLRMPGDWVMREI